MTLYVAHLPSREVRKIMTGLVQQILRRLTANQRLDKAVRDNDPVAAQLALEDGANPNTQIYDLPREPFYRNQSDGNVSSEHCAHDHLMVKLYEDRPAIAHAVLENFHEVATLLLNAGADVPIGIQARVRQLVDSQS